MTTTGVYTPLDYEDRLRCYLFERSEEGRAVRVGEKEVSEQAEIVARYADAGIEMCSWLTSHSPSQRSKQVVPRTQ